ncbi:MAG: PD40 domain-containing protein [Bryobacterales bacterium]|nr:PD40 domain-containing protein [Bryobacterales bacterium]
MKWCFGPFEYDQEARELRKRGIRLKVGGQPLVILDALLARPGEVVKRSELRDLLWPGQAFGEYETGMNVALMKLRQALGDTASKALYIETIPRTGYRFIAPVERIPPPAPPGLTNSASLAESAPIVAPPEAPAPAPITSSRLRRYALYAGIFGVLLIASSAAAWRMLREPERVAPMRLSPLTTLPSREETPSISPEGNYVAFSGNGEDGSNWDIYVILSDGSEMRRLTTDKGSDRYPVWSPDGKRIAFVRDANQVIVISLLGGEERRICETRGYTVAWAPDGRSLIVPRRDEPGSAIFHLDRVPLDGSPASTYVPASARPDGFLPFSYSRDGRQFAYIRSARGGSAVVVQDAGGSNARDLVRWSQPIRGLAWAPSDQEIVVAVAEQKLLRLARVSVNTGNLRFLGEGLDSESAPAFGRTLAGNTLLVFERAQFDQNLHESSFAQPGSDQTLATSRVESSPSYSSDGSRIAFVSNRSGPDEIWVSDHNGKRATMLTNLGREGKEAGSPKWSPDAKWIVFDAVGDSPNIYRVPAAGGPAVAVTNWPSEQVRPSYSRDGRWIYFGSNFSGSFEIWRVPAGRTADDTKDAVMMTRGGGYEAQESTDGRWLWYRAERDPGALWRMPAAGGTAEKIVDAKVPRGWWAPGREGIYYVDWNDQPPSRPGRRLVMYFHPSSQSKQVAEFTARIFPATPDFAVTPDEERWMYSAIELNNTDLMMVTDWR